MEKVMKEELTTKMHSEFSVSEETDIKHRVWRLLSYCDSSGVDEKTHADYVGLTMEQVEKHKTEYQRLLAK